MIYVKFMIKRSKTKSVLMTCLLLLMIFTAGDVMGQDTTPPTVVSSSPANGAVNVSVNLAGLSITFSEPMSQNFSYSTDFTIWGVSPPIHSWSPEGTVLTFSRNPSVALPVGVTIAFTINNLRDIAGNYLSPNPLVISFLVGASVDLPPSIVSTNPSNGATDVSRNLTSVSITFSEPMNPGFLNIYSNFPAYNPSWSDYNRVLTLTRIDTQTPLMQGTNYVFNMNPVGGVTMRDTQGNALPLTTFSFQTQQEYQLLKIPEDPSNGFHWPYYLLIPNSLSSKTVLLVETNNTGYTSDDIALHDAAAESLIRSRSDLVIELDVPILVPTFPRPSNPGYVYTHALDRYSLTTTATVAGKSIQRIDLQLISMIADARKRLATLGHVIDKRIFMHGFSASGAFTSRFNLLHSWIVKAAAPGSPGGWPTAPVSSWNIPSYGVTTLRYPVGVADVESLTGKPFDLQTYKRVPHYIYVGDVDQNDALDTRDFPLDEKTAICAWLNCDPDPWIADRWPISETIYDYVDANAQFAVYPRVAHTITEQMFSDIKNFFNQKRHPIITNALAGAFDVNANNRSDVLWMHTVSGTVALWMMDGTTISSVGVAGAVPNDWQVKGVGDFNGDGRSDILWMHSTTGTVAIWMMNGTTITSVGVAGAVPNDWQVKGVGDFNGDGKSDILWQHPVSGTVAIWLVDGTTISSVGVVGAISSDWQVKGVGDFNANGKSDVLWYHPATGTVALWLMDGTTISSVGVAGAVPSDWQVKGVGDFNGDGRSDILWQHPTSGTVALWLMDGISITSVGVAGATPSDWQVKGVGDFNANGKSDVLWFHPATGTVALWLMDGTTLSSVGVAGAVPSGWEIKN